MSERLAVQPHQVPAVHAASDPPSEPPMGQAASPSLPPAKQDADLVASPAPPAEANWRLPKKSKIRKTALVIVAMRAQGYTSEEICKALSLKPHSVRQYLWLAGKNGWLTDKLSDPHDEIEFNLGQTVVRNLKEMLESDQILEKGQRSVKVDTTLEVAKGVLFKKFDQPKESAPPATNVLAIRIEGASAPARVADGGAPMYVEGEVIKHGTTHE